MTISKKPWEPAFKNRGHGHGDFGILDADGNLIAEIVERIPEKGTPFDEIEVHARDNMEHVVLACNYYDDLVDDLVDACEEALRRLVRVSNLLNGGASKEDVQKAYNITYPGTLREILNKVRPDLPENHCEVCGFHTHEAKDCPYKE